MIDQNQRQIKLTDGSELGLFMFFLFPKAEKTKNLISKVFSAEKMNHAKTQAGPPGLHCWQNSRGLGCYQGDPNGACLWPLALHD